MPITWGRESLACFTGMAIHDHRLSGQLDGSGCRGEAYKNASSSHPFLTLQSAHSLLILNPSTPHSSILQDVPNRNHPRSGLGRSSRSH